MLNDQLLQQLEAKYAGHYDSAVARRLARELAESLNPALEPVVAEWLRTGIEQPFEAEYNGAVYPMLGAKNLLDCSYLEVLERMNAFLENPDENYYKLLPY